MKNWKEKTKSGGDMMWDDRVQLNVQIKRNILEEMFSEYRNLLEQTLEGSLNVTINDERYNTIFDWENFTITKRAVARPIVIVLKDNIGRAFFQGRGDNSRDTNFGSIESVYNRIRSVYLPFEDYDSYNYRAYGRIYTNVTMYRVDVGEELRKFAYIEKPYYEAMGVLAACQHFGIKEYRIVTSKECGMESDANYCRAMGNRQYSVNDAQSGMNFPPLRYGCTCKIVPVVGVEGEIPMVEGLNTRQVFDLKIARGSKRLIDLQTRKTLNVYWEANNNYHTDWTPMTSVDTDVVKSLLLPNRASNWDGWNNRDTWTNAGAWNARHGVIELNGRFVAVGFHLFPHDRIMGDTIAKPGLPLTNRSGVWDEEGKNKNYAIDENGRWVLGGHMCMYYGDSPSGKSVPDQSPAKELNDAARKALKEGFK